MRTSTRTVFFTIAMAAFAAAGGVYTVGIGETLVVTDGTVGNFSGGIAFDDASGVVEFNTTSAPTMDISGAGTVKKTSSSSSWTMTRQLPNFSGDYVLQGAGRVTATGDASGSARYLFGNETGALDIRSGAELYAPNTGDMPMFYTKLVKIAGNGANAYGAIQTLTGTHNMSGNFLSNLKLTANARVDLEGNGYLQFFNSNGRFDMDGHELTLVGNGRADFTGGFTIASNGTIRLTCHGTPGIKLQIRNHLFRTEATDDPFYIDDVGSIYYYYDGAALHNDDPILRPLVVSGSRAMVGVQHQNALSPSTFTNLCANVWASKITLNGSASRVNMMSSLAQQQFNVTGEITGEGSVAIGASDLRQTAANENRGRIYFANTNNTYQGFTYVNNFFNEGKWGQFLAAGPHSIPNYSSLTGNYGTVALRMKARESEDETLWTDGTFIRDLANAGTWINNCSIGLDTTFYDGLFTMNYPEGITNAAAFLGGSGPGEVLITNVVGTAENPLRFQASGGVTTVTTRPGEPQYLGEARASAPTYGSTNSVLCFKDCDLVMPEGCKFNAGFNKSDDGFHKAIQFKNTRLVAETLRNDWANYDSDVIRIGGALGDSACGLMEIYDGTVVTGRLAVTGTGYGGFGAVYQYGGSVTALGRASSCDYSSGVGCTVGGHNHGYYEMHGGDFTACGKFAIGNAESGYWKQYGGSFLLTNALESAEEPEVIVGTGNAQAYAFALHVAGGTFDVGNGRMSVNTGYSADRQYANVTVSGEDAFLNLRERDVWPGNIASAETQFTLKDGGRMRIVGIKKGHGDSKLSVNFDGGVWECSANNAQSGGDVFQTYRTDDRWTTCWSDVFIYAGGATIDTAGKIGNGTYRVVNGSFGSGISGLVDSFEPFATGPWAPIVRVYGDGQGAVAEADWDKETGMVKGIKVIAPGVGYTWAKVKFCSGREAAHETACTIAPNANTGSFTKTGEGTFFLGAANTWGGATIVKGGTLRADCDWAVPADSAVVLAGGDLDFNHMEARVSSITYGAGGGAVKNAENVKVTGETVLMISTEELAAGKAIALAGNVDLSQVTLAVTGSVDCLMEGERYAVATTDGQFAGMPQVSLDPSLAEWHVTCRGNRLTLSFANGFLLIVR